jgi:hypothetical protein
MWQPPLPIASCICQVAVRHSTSNIVGMSSVPVGFACWICERVGGMSCFERSLTSWMMSCVKSRKKLKSNGRPLHLEKPICGINPVHPFVNFSTYPHIINLMFSCLVSPLPPDPQNRCQNPGAPVLPYFAAHKNPTNRARHPSKPGPDPPKRVGHPSETGQDTPKRVGRPPNPPRWHPKMAKLTPRWPNIARKSAQDGPS